MTRLLVLLMAVWFGISLAAAMVPGLFWLSLTAIALLMATGALTSVRATHPSRPALPRRTP
jgi:nitrogen fixation/metabolism regulation signal transduction histidine kinase